MKTFFLIIKILPWVLSIIGGGLAYLKNKKANSLKNYLEEKTKVVEKLREIIITQGEHLEQRSKQITELMRINDEYEKKKTSVKNSKTATKSMAAKRDSSSD